jgi:hypothetical protein
MRTPALGLPVLALALLLLASPSSAQHIYLDSNGDGVHTAADVLHGVGPTVVDVWLDTGHNRDGTATVCGANPATPLDMFSYVVNLKAAGGTVSYSTFTNRIAQFATISPSASDGVEFFGGYYSTFASGSLAPGRYLLGSVEVNVVSGTPSVGVVTDVAPALGFFNPTAFGSNCDGTQNPNTITYGVDWFDADGLPFGSGGMANQSPSLSQPANMTVPSGETAVQTLTATDADGQRLTLAKSAGPAFLFVQTTDGGSGTAHGEIRLAPFASNVGTYTGGVSASDGQAVDQKSFNITVSQSSGHSPVLFDIPRLTVIAGNVGRQFISAGDPDGQTLHFSKVSGPAYAQLTELASRSGGASAALRAAPGLCDVGPAVARVAVTDGVSQAFRDVALNVLPPSAPPDSVLHLTSNAGIGFAVRVGDLNGDGKGDVVVTYEDLARVTVLLGRGDGTLSPGVSYNIGTSANDLVLADFNGDGALDVAAVNSVGSSLSVLLGRGDGTLVPATAYPTGQAPQAIAAADMNRDGILDLAVTNQAAGTLSVLLGVGDGTFRPKRDSAAGPRPSAVVIADFNLDGRPDAVVASPVPGSVGSVLSVLPGLGDGSFGDPLQTTFNGFPLALATGDWNWDGSPDLAMADGYFGQIKTFAGHGDGTFSAPNTIATGLLLPFGSAAGDLNGDGNTDLVVTDGGQDNAVILLGDGNGGFASPRILFGTGAFVALGDMNSDGRPDFASAWFGNVGVLLNHFGPANPAEARAFVQGGHPMPASSGNNDVAIQLEPLHGSYTSDLLNIGSVTLSSEGTGSVSLIHSVAAKRIVEADRDGNGVPEVEIDFARADFTRLFDQLHGRTAASADLAGSLTDGRAFCADVALTIVGTGQPHQVVFAPNPLNPQSKLSFTTVKEGPARALLFDIHGRLVRTILDQGRLPAGAHEFTFDGKTDRGAALSSGVYFYRVESTDGRSQGQIVILK